MSIPKTAVACVGELVTRRVGAMLLTRVGAMSLTRVGASPLTPVGANAFTHRGASSRIQDSAIFPTCGDSRDWLTSTDTHRIRTDDIGFALTMIPLAPTGFGLAPR